MDLCPEVKHLCNSLTSVKKIIDEANGDNGNGYNRTPFFPPQDMQSLHQICGDSMATVRKFRALLDRNRYFKHHGDLISNICWDFTVQSEVTRLRDQLRSHRVKIQSVLEPLAFQLSFHMKQFMERSHGDIVDRMGHNHEDILAHLNRLKCGSTSNLKQLEHAQVEAPLQVPPELDHRFFSSWIEFHSASENATCFLLENLVEAFVIHFEESMTQFSPGTFRDQQISDAMHFLNLMKCLWILSRIKSSHEYIGEQPNSLWRTYIQRLEDRLRKKTDRFSKSTPESKRLREPATEDILIFSDESFRTWIDDDLKGIPEPLYEGGLTDMLLDFSLPPTENGAERRFNVLRPSIDTLRVVASVVTISPNKTEKLIREYDINLAKVQLIPLYATPASSADALNLKFKDEDDRGISVSFKKPNDLTRFQHALTGCYVACDVRDVSTESFYHQNFKISTRVFEKGRLQLWVSKRLEKPPVKHDSDKLNGTTSNRSAISPSATAISNCTAGAESLSHSAAVSYAQSALPALHRASTFAAPEGLGHLHDKPKPPLIVLFLQKSIGSYSDSGEQRSFLTIKIDPGTFVNRQACDCRKKDRQCLDSSVEHKSGIIGASRYSIATDLDAWNVAAPGSWQQHRQENHKVDRNLKWVKIRFQNIQDRVRFASSAYPCKGNDLKPSDNCTKDHCGAFGKVRISYVQKLAEYNNRHNRHNLPHVVN